MKEQFVPYEQALKLKELGFYEPCLALWQSIKKGEPFVNIKDEQMINYLLTKNLEDVEYIVKAPLWQQAFDWFREKHKLAGCVDCLSKEFVDFMPEICEKPFRVHITHTVKSGISYLMEFDSYEEGRQACLEKLIEIINKL